mgnify:CR=1 FL=1
MNKPQTLTAVAIAELERCIDTLRAYEADPGSWASSGTHAAAFRASLDATKVLARWRKAGKVAKKDGVCK